MTTFEDGPAKGQRLMLHRAARFLRATEASGKWDALDQIADVARPEEKLYAYEITGEPGMCFIHASGNRSGFYPLAHYRFFPIQPSQEIMRSNTQWHEWCVKQVSS